MISEDISSKRKHYLAIMAEHGTMSPEDIVTSLVETQTELHAIFSSASVEQAGVKPAPDEWSLLGLARHAAVEKGCTTPVVPRIDIPSTIPSLGLSVFLAISSPPGTEISTRKAWFLPRLFAVSPTACVILLRGTRVMDG